MRLSPEIKQMIKLAGDKIFNNMPVVPRRQGFKVLKRHLIGPAVVNHFVKDNARAFRKIDPTFETEAEVSRREKSERLKRAGKGPPKKGAGKRSKKK